MGSRDDTWRIAFVGYAGAFFRPTCPGSRAVHCHQISPMLRARALGAARPAARGLCAKLGVEGAKSATPRFTGKLACLDLEGVLIPEVRMIVHRERRRRAQPLRSRARRCG